MLLHIAPEQNEGAIIKIFDLKKKAAPHCTHGLQTFRSDTSYKYKNSGIGNLTDGGALKYFQTYTFLFVVSKIMAVMALA
jgi:hypothetical protein